MKIVAGMGNIEDYIRLVEAGVDEVFCGYVPFEWNQKYGSMFPLNRREGMYYNTQIGSLSDMKILKRMVAKYKVPVTITFNYLYYLEEQYPIIEKLMRQLMEIGFDEFIIADLGLIVYLREHQVKCKIQLSGECSELNRLSMKVLDQFHLSRYIFHRKHTIEDMASCISSNSDSAMTYEAFILNERCHYTGAFCQSLHCDELVHLCKMVYEVGKIDEISDRFPQVDERLLRYYEEEDRRVPEGVGSSGCGLCALQQLQRAGITHLKVVGRGNFIDRMEEDIRYLKKALDLLSDDKKSYVVDMKKQLFDKGCSERCYYY